LTNAQLVTHYLTALASNDTQRARSLLSDDFSFRGPMDFRIDGKDAFLAATEAKYKHVQELRILRQWEDGDDVCSVYELDVATSNASASVLMSEWNSVRDGQVASALLVFDTSTLAAQHA
jgi:hypothetical protein